MFRNPHGGSIRRAIRTSHRNRVVHDTSHHFPDREAEQRLADAEQDNVDLRAFLSIIRKCTDLKEPTPELVNRLITRIEVFDSTKDENGKKHVPIKVHFIGVGVLEIPDGKTILETYEEIRKNPPIVA